MVPSLTAVFGVIGLVLLIGALLAVQPLLRDDHGAVSSDATHVYSLAFQTAAAADTAAVTGDLDAFAATIDDFREKWDELERDIAGRGAASEPELATLGRELDGYLTGLASYVAGDTSAAIAGQSLQTVASGLQQLINNLAVTVEADQARQSDARLRGSILVALAAVAFAAAVTRIQRASQRAHQSAGERERLLSIAEGLSAGLITAGADGRVDYLNTRAADLLAIDPETTVGAPLPTVYEAFDIPNHQRAALNAVPDETHAVDEVHFVLERTDDRSGILDVSRFAIEVNGRRTGIGHLVRDITREHEVDRMKTEFVAVASHELRTPLTGILGYSELLQDDPGLTEAGRAWADRIVDEAGRLSDIVGDLLNITRIESGRLELEPARIDLPPLLEDVQAHFTGGRRSPNHELSLEQQYRGYAFADPGKLREVLINLVDNAIKYSPDGGAIRIVVHAGDGAALISVSDEGIGIAEEDLPRLFKRFQRVGGEGTATIRGTGLGLYIVKTFVDAMGGELSVSSTLGQGSTFTVTLPREAPAAAAA